MNLSFCLLLCLFLQAACLSLGSPIKGESTSTTSSTRTIASIQTFTPKKKLSWPLLKWKESATTPAPSHHHESIFGKVKHLLSRKSSATAHEMEFHNSNGLLPKWKLGEEEVAFMNQIESASEIEPVEAINYRTSRLQQAHEAKNDIFKEDFLLPPLPSVSPSPRTLPSDRKIDVDDVINLDMNHESAKTMAFEEANRFKHRHQQLQDRLREHKKEYIQNLSSFSEKARQAQDQFDVTYRQQLQRRLAELQEYELQYQFGYTVFAEKARQARMIREQLMRLGVKVQPLPGQKNSKNSSTSANASPPPPPQPSHPAQQRNNRESDNLHRYSYDPLSDVTRRRIENWILEVKSKDD